MYTAIKAFLSVAQLDVCMIGKSQVDINFPVDLYIYVYKHKSLLIKHILLWCADNYISPLTQPLTDYLQPAPWGNQIARTLLASQTYFTVVCRQIPCPKGMQYSRMTEYYERQSLQRGHPKSVQKDFIHQCFMQCLRWTACTVDSHLFVTRWDTQLLMFNLPFPDQTTFAVDALSVETIYLPTSILQHADPSNPCEISRHQLDSEISESWTVICKHITRACVTRTCWNL